MKIDDDKYKVYEAKVTKRIYEKLKYDQDKLRPYIRVTPEQIKVNISHYNDEYFESFGYQLYSNKKSDTPKCLFELPIEKVLSIIDERINNLNIILKLM